MPSDGVICCLTGRACDIASCRERAANGECQYPLPMFGYLATKNDGRKDAGLSVTTLLGCHRKAELEREHRYPIQPETMGSRFQGDMWHTAMEQWVDEPDVIKERRAAIEIDGVVVTGKSDLVIPRTKLVADWKTTSKPLYCDEGDGWCNARRIVGPPDGYVHQVSAYRLLLEDGYWLDTGEPCGLEIDKAILGFFNPTNGSRTFPVPLLDKDYMRDYLAELIAPVVRSREDGVLPEILTPNLVKRRTGRVSVQRDFRCKNCELRGICDRIATMDRGTHPDSPQYWEDNQ